MANIDKTGCGTTNGVVPHSGAGKVYVMKNTIDLTDDAITAADVYQVLAIPANTRVKNVVCEIETAAVGTTLTMDIGDGGATNGWDASVNGMATAGTVTSSAVGTDARAAAASQGYLYTTADSIDIVMTTATAITAGPKLTLYAECVDYN